MVLMRLNGRGLVLLVERFRLRLGKERLIFRERPRNRSRLISILRTASRRASLGGQGLPLRPSLILGDGLARQNDRLISRRWPVFRTPAFRNPGFWISGFRTARWVSRFRRGAGKSGLWYSAISATTPTPMPTPTPSAGVSGLRLARRAPICSLRRA